MYIVKWKLSHCFSITWMCVPFDIEKVFCFQVKLYTVASKVYELDDKEVGKVIIHPTPLSGKVR